MDIIAEIGVNWDNLSQAFDMIEKSKNSGCSSAKFQLYDENVIQDSPLRSELGSRMLSKEDAQELVDFGESIRQPVFFSTMFLEAIDWVAEMNCPFIKIRYSDKYNFQLVRQAMRAGKPILMSIDHSFIDHYHDRGIRFLYCVSAYPARPEDYAIRPEDFSTGASPGAHVFSGVSDHSQGTKIMSRALDCGVEFCEVHVMLKGTHPIDEVVSKTFEEVKSWIKQY